MQLEAREREDVGGQRWDGAREQRSSPPGPAGRCYTPLRTPTDPTTLSAADMKSEREHFNCDTHAIIDAAAGKTAQLFIPAAHCYITD